jgi:hypothetical protein
MDGCDGCDGCDGKMRWRKWRRGGRKKVEGGRREGEIKDRW